MSHAPSIETTNLRDMFRPSTNKIPPDLRRALILLNLTSMADLEEHLLATTAFLAPWTAYRDACLLVNSLHCDEPTTITRMDILWFYTQFDQDIMRHDPRAERSGASFEIDKSKWGAVEYEKHLYVWLLQTFCVGKAHSSFGFRYFELRNVCTAWDEVFVPIVTAVRASYSVKGRRHYGRLALFIEERSPSRLAFPEGNISMPNGVISSPTPFRMVSKTTQLRGASQTLLTKRNYDDTERELRDVYPQYGGLIERPRFKQKMDEWLEVQRMRAAYRKRVTKPEVVEYGTRQYVPKYQPQIVQQVEGKGNESLLTTSTPAKRSPSPLKRYSDSIRRSLSMNVGSSLFGKSEPQSPLSAKYPSTPDTPKVPMIPYGKYSYVPKIPQEEPKSPLHGVTRQIHIHEDESDHTSLSSHKTDVTGAELSDSEVWPLPASPLRRPESLKQQLLEQTVYTTICKSNPYDDVTPSNNPEDHVWSPMGAPSAIPPPLKQNPGDFEEPMPQPLLKPNKSLSEPRQLSYEGNGYHDEISLTNLHFRNFSAGSDVNTNDLKMPKPRSRLPAPIKLPPPYATQVRIASHGTNHEKIASQPVNIKHPGEPSKPVAWQSFDESLECTLPPHVASGLAPPIPPKSPERRLSMHGPRSERLPHRLPLREDEVSHEMLRIVSKENIRAALSNLTPESSTENLKTQDARKAPMQAVGPLRLEPYNTHMFPRKRGPSNGV